MKKLVTGVVVLLLLLAGAFFAIGIAVPSYDYTNTVEINRSIDTSWNYFADETKAKEWLRGLKSMELISGQARRPGAKFKMEFEEDGRQVVMTETVIEYVPRDKMSMVLENDQMKNEMTIKFTDAGGRTTIEQKTKVTGGNPIWRSLFALMKPTFRNTSQEMLEKLKFNVEKLPPSL